MKRVNVCDGEVGNQRGEIKCHPRNSISANRQSGNISMLVI